MSTITKDKDSDKIKRPEFSERIGLLIVHGIGDQDRHEHLQSVAREIIKAAVIRHGKIIYPYKHSQVLVGGVIFQL